MGYLAPADFAKAWSDAALGAVTAWSQMASAPYAAFAPRPPAAPTFAGFPIPGFPVASVPNPFMPFMSFAPQPVHPAAAMLQAFGLPGMAGLPAPVLSLWLAAVSDMTRAASRAVRAMEPAAGAPAYAAYHGEGGHAAMHVPLPMPMMPAATNVQAGAGAQAAMTASMAALPALMALAFLPLTLMSAAAASSTRR